MRRVNGKHLHRMRPPSPHNGVMYTWSTHTHTIPRTSYIVCCTHDCDRINVSMRCILLMTNASHSTVTNMLEMRASHLRFICRCHSCCERFISIFRFCFGEKKTHRVSLCRFSRSPTVYDLLPRNVQSNATTANTQKRNAFNSSAPPVHRRLLLSTMHITI